MTLASLRHPIARRGATMSAGAALCLLLSGCVLGPLQLERETREIRVEHQAAAPIEVRTNNGSVEILAEPGAPDVRIVADLRAQTIDRLERTSVIAARDVNGTLRISVEWPDGKALNSEGCDFDITLPDALGADIRTSNGAIHLNGLGGSAHVRSSNGRLEITRHDGDVDASSSNGAVIITDPTGTVRADTSNGAVQIINAPSSVEADTSNGRVTIIMTEDAPGPVVADSSNGRIELHVGKGFTGRLSLSTSNGRVTADESLGPRTSMRTVSLGKRSGAIEFGEGGPESRCTTSNGAIEVRPRSE